MKTILIPTDFTVHSLDIIVATVEKYKNERLNIVLMHGLTMPDSIMDLMLLSRNNDRYKLITREFENACLIIKNKYASVLEQITIKFMHGNSRAMFRSFLDANKVDMIVYPQDYLLCKACESSIDIARLLKYARCHVDRIVVRPEPVDVKKINMSDLLLAVS